MKNAITPIIAALALQVSSPGLDEAFRTSKKICCSGEFTISNIIRILTPINSGAAEGRTINFTVIWERDPSSWEFGSTSEASLHDFKADFYASLPSMPGLAYILESKVGASAILWNPKMHLYQRQHLRGTDPFQLTNETEIIYIRELVNNDRTSRNGIKVWAWSKSAIKEESAIGLLKECEERFNMQVTLIVGDSPLLWRKGGGGFPLAVPAMGRLGTNGILNSSPTRVLRCGRSNADGLAWCLEEKPMF